MHGKRELQKIPCMMSRNEFEAAQMDVDEDENEEEEADEDNSAGGSYGRSDA